MLVLSHSRVQPTFIRRDEISICERVDAQELQALQVVEPLPSLLPTSKPIDLQWSTNGTSNRRFSHSQAALGARSVPIERKVASSSRNLGRVY